MQGLEDNRFALKFLCNLTSYANTDRGKPGGFSLATGSGEDHENLRM